MNIGFIGLGVMGQSMVRNLMKKGYTVFVYTRTKTKAESLIIEGAKWCDTVAETSKQADVVITMVGYPADVEEVYFGESGVLQNIKKESYVIDMTTSTPSLAKKIYDVAKELGISSLDAPVSGGDIGARDAKLTIMIGGDQEAVAVCEPIFACMGTNIVHQGVAGAGQHTKMSNQIAIAGAMIAMCESLAYAKAAGLDLETVLKSIAAGSAGSWSLNNLAPRIVRGDFAPGFFVKHFVKDMAIALREAEVMGIHLPGLETVKKLYDELVEQGDGNCGTQALYTLYK